MEVADAILNLHEDEFPALDGVVSPRDTLILKHGKPIVDEAHAFLRRLGLIE